MRRAHRRRSSASGERAIASASATPSPGTPGEGRGEGLLSPLRECTRSWKLEREDLTPTLSRSSGRGGKRPPTIALSDEAWSGRGRDLGGPAQYTQREPP